MPKPPNGAFAPQPPQGQGKPPDTFSMIKVFLDEGVPFEHPYAKHQINMGPDGGVLLVQETKGDQEMFIYPMNRVMRTVLTPTKLTVV